MRIPYQNGFRPLPDGMRDLPPDETAVQRHVEISASRVMESWGYAEIVPSTVQFDGTVPGAGRYIKSGTYRFSDSRGRALSLRPDMTVPVARMLAAASWSFPAKVYYIGNVFRMEEDRSGKPHEFSQAGAEVFGLAGPWADAEIIALCAECLRASGIEEFRIGIGNVEVTDLLLEQAGIKGELRSEALDALQRRDMVSFDRIVSGSGAGPGTLEHLHASLRPLNVDRIAGSGALSEEALRRVGGIIDGLKAFGVEDAAYLDMSIVRDMSYYTGMVFQVYGKGLGRSAGGGGRYDGLMQRFGIHQPATGFALRIPEVAALVRRQDGALWRTSLVLVAGPEGGSPRGIALARSLREKSLRVRVDSDHCSRSEAKERAAAMGAVTLYYLDSGELEEFSVERGLDGASWAGWLSGSPNDGNSQ